MAASASSTSGRPLFYSGGMHLALLLLALVGLPDLFDSDVEPQPIVVTLEPLPISNISNVKPVDAPIAKPKPTPPTPTRVEKSTPAVEQKKPEPKENPVKVQDKDAPPEKKPEEKPKEKPQNKDDLDSILKSVREQAQQTENKEAPKKPTENVQEAGAKSENYDPTIPMSLTELDAIKNQIARCWSPPAGAKDDYTLLVTVNVEVSPDGTILKAMLSTQSQMKSAGNPAYYAAARSALVALKKPECQRLENLPTDKYGTWKEMELVFDPKFLY